MDIDAALERLGFPKHSGAVFLALETSGPFSVSALSRHLHVHRPALYRALLALSEKGLVSKKTFGRRPLYASEPRAGITRLFAAAVHDIAHEEQDASERSIRNSMGAIRYFEGTRTVAAIFSDVVAHSRRGDTFYRYTSERDLDSVNRLLPHNYRAHRDAKRLERLVISNPESGKRKRGRLERFVKFLGSEKESFHQNAIQLIYGTRVAFVDLNAHRGFIIENETLAEFQKTIFRALYKRL